MSEDKNKFVEKCHFLVTLISIIIIFTSLLVFIGSLIHIPVLTSISSAWINMKINTDICFLLAGYVILLRRNPGLLSDTLAAISAVFILLISSMTLFEYLTDINLNIDQLLVKDYRPLSPGTTSPGRMTLIAAINLILVGCSFLLLLKKSASVWIMQTFGYVIMLISLISLFNYLYGANTSYAFAKYTTMAMPTTILFILISIGILLLKPDSGIIGILQKNNSSGYLLRRIIAFPIILLTSTLFIENYLEAKGIIDPSSGSTITQIGVFAITGLIIILAAIILDQKERKLAEAEIQIQHNDMIFRQFAENIDIVFYTSSPDLTQIRYVSPAYEAIWGRSTASLYKNPREWFESVLPEDQPIAYKAFSLDPKGMPSASAEYRIIRPDGLIRHIFARVHQLRDENNVTFCIIGIAIDMTNMKIEKLYKGLEHHILRLMETEKNIYELCPKYLKMICHSLDWDVGELWLVDESKNILRCFDIWHQDIKTLNEFDKKSRQYTYGLGEGLPGKVWKERKATWVADFPAAQTYPRSRIGEEAGLHNALAIPIIYQTKVYGVLVFFSFEMKKPDEPLLTLLENMGKLIGEFIKHTHTVEQLQAISRQDLLTGLFNRSALEEDLTQLIAGKQSKSIVVMVVDIDRFKLINEALGHAYGDILLKSIAVRLSELNDHNQINLARLGADKFIIYIPDANKADALDYAHMIQRKLSDSFEVSDNKTILSITIGIALYPENGLDSKTLVTNADLALIPAKDQGGNRINFFSSELPLIALEKISLDTDLRQAIANNQFVLAYQPQFDLRTGNICAAEALIRWQHPIRGLLYPDTFIAFAERAGLTVSLNEHIMRMVIQQISLNPSLPPISINISAQQFQDGFHLIEYLESLMKAYDVKAAQIELEITENMLMKDTEHNISVLTALLKLGVQIAVDDFGTGFSSFSYVNRLPIQKIKIDKSFITGLPRNFANAKIVKAIISMLHSLDKIVVAEGAETKAAADFLRQQNCDIVQGFYYYKPMPLQDLIATLAKINADKMERT